MHFATFSTDAPLHHLARALDELARAGFDLCRVSLMAETAPATVQLQFRGQGAIGPCTLRARIGALPGVSAMTDAPLVAAQGAWP